MTASLSSDGFDCNVCGACCSYSSTWPRFSTETDFQLDQIPPENVSRDGSGMRCDGARCSALVGKVGTSTSCSIYENRPDVCRACEPGGDDCLMARRALGLLRPASAEELQSNPPASNPT
ncbi:Fe-S oxidoreductase [Mesorhizobium loti]|nr:YkgJ family cysteine cluster protein [Mesorhizobium loti]PLP55589.1 Fe-S oxidoreductase [Mesorhizobium loti]